MPRPPHGKGHPGCPHPNWSACDKAEQMRFGQCVAVTGVRAPTPCVRWAVSESGWCWQHYASKLERIRREEKEAARMALLNSRADAHIAWTAAHPSIFDNPGDAKYRKRKPPFRLEAPA